MFALLRNWGKRPTTGDVPVAGAAVTGVVESPATNIDVQKMLHRLEWSVIRRLDGRLQGDYRTLFRGSGLDLAELREYQLHDDVRHIDWNVTARMQTPYVRDHQEDREVAAWLLLDISGSVSFGSTQRTKRDVALELAGVMARILTRRGNSVGAMLYTGSTRGIDCQIPSASGKRHVMHLMDQIVRRTPSSPGQGTDLSLLLGQAGPRIRRRSCVFVISDFLSKPGWEKPMAQLASRHDVIAVRLCDPLEMKWPETGLVRISDAETGEQMYLDGSDAGFRKRFEAIALRREAELRTAFSNAGVDCLELHTDEAIDDALLSFIAMRKSRANGQVRKMLSGNGAVVSG